MNSLTQDERAALVESVRELAWKFVWQIVVPQIGGEWMDDGLQECLLAAVRSSQTFDPARGVRFCTYAYQPMRWAAQQFVYARERDERSAATPDLDNRAGPATGPPEDWAERADEAAMVRRMIAKLPAEWRRVIRLRFGLAGEGPLPQPAAARAVGVGRQCLQDRERKAKARLRTMMGASA